MTNERHESTAEREGIVDQQDAVIEQMRADTPAVDESARPTSTAEREGIVDQQGAAIEASEPDKPQA